MIPDYGFVGAAIGTIAAELFCVCYSILCIKQTIKDVEKKNMMIFIYTLKEKLKN